KRQSGTFCSTNCVKLTSFRKPYRYLNYLFSFPAAKGKGKGMAKEDVKGPEVCKDPLRLTSYAVGANILKQGEDPKLKPAEEYPEWLFQLNLGDVKRLHELEPDSLDYWNRLRKENIWRYNKLHKGKSF
uniref:Large ribosomal subunit protein mL54 n=1 Tax=Oryzias latipes TaxID=8090 RepID=A0A3P9HQJ2_ORYLA